MKHRPDRTRLQRPGHGQLGLTLVELMVALGIGIFITAGLIQLLVATKQSFRATDEMSRLQDNGRFAIEYMTREIRQAGSKGACTRTVSSLLDTSDDAYTANRFDLATIRGWNGSAGDDPDADAGKLADHVSGTDVIFVKGAGTRSGLKAQTALGATSATTISLTGSSGALHDAIVVIVTGNGYACDMFQNASSDNATNLSRASGAGEPGNLDPTTNNFSSGYGTDMEILLFHSRQYFIATNDAGIPSLWERRFDKGGYQDIELVERVANMQITYGLDTDSDDFINRYADAATVEGANQWGRVVAVKINLLLQSEATNLTESAMSLPLSDGSTFTAPTGDRHLYQMFTSTIGLRNRLH